MLAEQVEAKGLLSSLTRWGRTHLVVPFVRLG
jgi:hypothetical protein